MSEEVRGARTNNRAVAVRLLWDALDRYGDAPALRVDDAPWVTFRQLRSIVPRVANALRNVGAERGDRIVIAYPADAWTEFAIVYLATLWAGAVAVLIPPELGTRERCLRAARCGRPPRLAVAINGHAVDGVRCVSHASLLAAAAESVPASPCDDHDVAEVLFTSGTTGEAKAVQLCFQHLLPAGTTLAPTLRKQSSVLHGFAPATFAGLHGAFLAHFVRGIPVQCVSRFEPARWAAIARHDRPFGIMLTSTMARALLRSLRDDLSSFESVRLVWLTGEAIIPSVVRDLSVALPRARVRSAYGATEAGHSVSIADATETRPNVVGYRDRGTIDVLDPRGRPLPCNSVGEVHLRNGGRGRRGKWVSTGDLGMVDNAGYVRLVGRRRRMIIVAGAKVPPRDVEDILRGEEGVEDIAVVGVPDPIVGEQVVAFVTGDVDVRAVRAFAVAHLQPSAVPSHIVVLDRLPVNGSGKVDFVRLSRMAGR